MGVIMNLFLSAVTGPKVYRVPVQSYSEESVEYESNPLESLLTALIDTAHSFYGLLKWTVILWGPWFLRNVQSHDHLMSYAKLACLGCVLYLTVLCTRGIGRLWNPTYVKFISLYRSAVLQPSETNLRQLTLYSFSSPWPALFDVRQLPSTVLHRSHINPPQRSTGIYVLLWPVT
ncbi:hypothetical protein CRM22_008858 [Opisthorchis felineus]|uniref:Phosphatidylserine Lipase ABHD16 N-terminal domain-containing protein n=1 Tax=Opisthorchis felineus TaxID=147828 RepID=A0A4S2LB96_OPIFE|nr:hypothetical protein CRM22_008858 [Opisthorchis felineus]